MGLVLLMMISIVSTGDRLFLFLVGGPLLLSMTAVLVGAPLCFLWGCPPSELDRLKPAEDLGESFPVQIAIMNRKLVTGTDWAYATFLDGWLLVEGLRTSFSLRACDVESLTTPEGKGCVLTLPGGQRVEITSSGRALSFREAVRIWHHYIIESPEGAPILPSNCVHGTAFAKPVSGVFASLAAALIGLGISFDGSTVLGTLVIVLSGYFFGRSAGVLGHLNGRVPLQPALEAENPS